MSDIVVGYDGSDCGKAALDEALRLAEGLGDRVVVVFGYLPPGVWGGEIVEHAEAIEERGKKVLEEAKAQAASSSVETEVRLVPNKPSQALVEVADELDAGLIVVGSNGEAPLKAAIIGSTPYKLLHLSGRPVLVVPATP
ncbi:MAG: universal stress protein [Solirubrobacterales bacterium]|jgi:nucleotide-binding universal stress UspA family protein